MFNLASTILYGRSFHRSLHCFSSSTHRFVRSYHWNLFLPPPLIPYRSFHCTRHQTVSSHVTSEPVSFLFQIVPDPFVSLIFVSTLPFLSLSMQTHFCHHRPSWASTFPFRTLPHSKHSTLPVSSLDVCSVAHKETFFSS